MDKKKKSKRIIKGRKKKKKKRTKQFWATKLKRYLPTFEAKDKYLKGNQDVVVLLKDNNGLFHTLRIPTYKQIKKWYEVMYGIDLGKLKKDDTIEQIKHKGVQVEKLKELKSIYCLPSPHEDLDWLAGQVSEAKREFSVQQWWQSPTIAYIGVGFICLMMMISIIILTGKMV